MIIREKQSKLKFFIPFLLLAPAFVLICIFKIYPMILSLRNGFYSDSGFSLKEYKLIFSDPTFWNSLKVTLKINVVMIPVQVLISLCLALIVNARVKGVGLFRSIYYLPVTISMSTAVVMWKLMMNYNSGVLNSLLKLLGINQQGFFIDSKQALWCIVILATWKGCGYWMMYLLAGLKGIDNSVYEAAKVDGAGYLVTLLKITLPLLKRTLLFVVVANTSTNLLMFAPMKMVTDGGPNGSTNVLMYEAYKSAFKYANHGRSAAITTVLLAIVLLVVAAQFKLLSKNSDD